MKLSYLHEDGYWHVYEPHPGGLGGSGKTKKKQRISPLKYPEDRGRWMKTMYSQPKKSK